MATTVFCVEMVELSSSIITPAINRWARLKEMYYLPLKAADATLNIIKVTAAEVFPFNPFKLSLTSFISYKRYGAGNHKKI